ncbi:MAG: FHA domain-containing protein [Fuerstiella sp.]|nr:FHA domain-containing protein [Fuerstiella sp.]
MIQKEQAWIRGNAVTYPISRQGEIHVGRSIQCSLRLFEDTSVSPKHCVIAFVNGRLEVTDLNSRTGTTVNGRRISGPTQLQHQDTISIGETELTVLFELNRNDGTTPPEFTLKS